MSTQNWQKLGRIYNTETPNNHLYSHASVPTAEYLGKDIYKIYFSSRDKEDRSFTNFLTIDITDPLKVLSISQEPVLSPGKLGAFDDSGAMASWLTKEGEKNYLYYIGWNLGQTVPFRNSIGLAIRSNSNKFSRYAEGPIVDRSAHEPHFCASCCVIPMNNIWHMWYLSCTEWRFNNERPEHRYHIKYAESEDGIVWNRKGLVAIDYLNENEIAISRPSVLYENDTWKMWFSYRSVNSTYRIGYAESNDAKNWVREPSSVLSPSDCGWDADMVEYPFVFVHKGAKYMLYNGNDYGRSGFGIAVLTE